METTGKASEYIKRRKFLMDQYGQGWKNQHRDVSLFLLPNRGYFDDTSNPNQGQETGDEIVDPEGTRSVMIFAAGMQGGLTSPARPWARFRMQDPGLNKYGPVKEWLNQVEKIFYAAYSQSNFYQVIYTDYIELIAFCTSCLLQEEGRNTVLNFRNQTAGTYYISTNSEGVVDTIFRDVPMIAKNIVERFKKVPEKIQNSAKKDPYKFFTVCQAVLPNNEREIGFVDGMNKPFKSVYFQPDVSDNILLQSGYEENPFHVSRYDVSGADVYGRGPGFDQMPNVKQLQEMQQTKYLALHKDVERPMLVPPSMIDDYDDLPGGVTPWEGGARPEELYKPNVKIGELKEDIRDLQEKVREGFFNDIFLMISSAGESYKNIPHIMEQKEEKLMMLGPIVDRTIYEKLDPIVERSLGILMRGGYLPPAPPEMDQQEMEIEYISILAQAQKRIGSSTLQEFGGYVAELATIKEDALDKMDFDQAIDEFGDMIGVSPKVIRDGDQVAEIREQRAQQQQTELEAQQIMDTIAGAKTLSETDTEGANALTDIAGVVAE